MKLVLSPSEAAEAIGLKPKTLAKLRQTGEGPVFTRLGGGKRSSVAYLVSDIEAFLQKGRRSSTAATAPPPEPS